MNQVLYTASHCVTPLGFGTAENFCAVQAGRSGLRRRQLEFAAEPFCVATLADDDLQAAFEPQQRLKAYTKLEKMSILAVAGVREQVEATLTGPDTLLVYCTTKGNIDLLTAPGPRRPLAPGLALSALAQTVARHFGFVNAPLVVSNACISSLQGLLIAQRLLRAGRYRQAVVVGADQVSQFTLAGFHSFQALSSQPCRPFDAARQGLNLGEAAAAVVLTVAPPTAGAIAVVAGSSTNDARHISAPSRTGEGLYQAVSRVLGPEPALPDFIGAHGTATRYNDEMEAQAFHRAALDTVPLHSLKGYFGHTLGASGVLEAALGIESLRRNELILSRGYETCGTSFPMQPIVQPAAGPLRRFLKTSSGFGGCNAAVLFAKAA